MKLRSVDKDLEDREVTDIEGTIRALPDLGFARAVADCSSSHFIAGEKTVRFTYSALTFPPMFSRPDLDRSPNPKTLKKLLGNLFIPYCVVASGEELIITVSQLPGDEVYHQKVYLDLYLKQEHHEIVREALEDIGLERLVA